MVTGAGPSVSLVPRRIQVLPADVVSRIAAGEVVERPAAVVKELIENSLDAGSRTITIEVRDGGLRSIRVVDDGEGMSRADALVAFQRHATSKVRSDQDLLLVRTLGFRGEALPSIASVSRVTLVTARRDEEIGTRLTLVAGTVGAVEEIAAPPGTQIDVRDLFFNTPARRKFLKTVATEFSHVSHVVQQASLGWPQVHFRLRHNGLEVVEAPGVASRRERVRQVYQRRLLGQCREVRGRGDGMTLEGLVIEPVHCRAGRTPQDLFVNNRPVKSPSIAHAVYEAYGTFLAKGRHPLFVLFVDVEPELVDVNVHPTKREVRFLNQELVYREVRRAVRDALGGASAEAHRQETVPPGAPSFRGAVGAPAAPGPGPGQGMARDRRGGASTQAAPSQLELGGAQVGAEGDAAIREAPGAYGVDDGEVVVPLGQVRRTFLVAQVGSELHVVDQHTAHERVLFERLVRAWSAERLASQPLLIPETIELPAHASVLLPQHRSELEAIGLVLEPFGAHTFVVRAVPAILERTDYAALVLDLLDDLANRDTTGSLDVRLRPMFATLACHGAVRAGRPMDLPEIKRVLEDWKTEGYPMTCPHGRRVALRLSMEELARIFGRSEA